MNPESFKHLLDQYITGNLSPEERTVLGKELNDPHNEATLHSALETSFLNDEFEGTESPALTERLKKSLHEKITSPPQAKRVHFLTRPFTRLVAACIFLLTLFGFLHINNDLFEKEKKSVNHSRVGNTDIAPGHNGAILTLANGEKILLDSLPNEQHKRQSGADILLHSDQVIYAPVAEERAEMTYNLLEVPRGRQFKVVLPDGTKVWLNAASSLRYPTAFLTGERPVEVTGEAYFEVAHDAAKPFIVKTGLTEMKVLGTHFNINTYEEDKAYVTLLEGLLQIGNRNSAVKINPGQQAQVSESINITDEVDTQEVIAWKEGKFQFGETADIKSVMRQISNWYDVDVVYRGTVTKHIGGTISRDVKLSQLLKVLETTGAVKFKVEGRTIEVSP